MNKPPESPYPQEDAGAHGASVDPWDEFPSESPDDSTNIQNAAALFESELDLEQGSPAKTQRRIETSDPSAEPLPAWGVTQAATWAIADSLAESSAASAPAEDSRWSGIAGKGGSSSDPGRREAVSPALPAREAQALVRVAARAVAPATTAAVSLTDIVSRRVPVEWPEAVATIEELCAALREEADTAIPEPGDVLITRSGQVVVRPGSRGERDIRLIGLMLHSLLSNAETPLPLRLFITSSTSSQRYSSVALYADALALYAVPTASRTDLIATLYRKTVELTAVPTVIEGGSDDAWVVRGRRGKGRKLNALAVAAATALVCGGGVTFWLWQTSVRAKSAAAPTAAVPAQSGEDTARVTAPAAPVERASAAKPRLRDDWRPGVVLSASGRRQLPEGVPSLAGAAVPLTPTGPVVLSARNTAGPAPVAAPSQPDSNATHAAADRLPAPERVPSASLAPIATSGVIDPTIYSRDDSDVLPPVMLSPSMSPYGKPGSTPGAGASNTLELLIDEKGSVASVKWLERPQRFIDAMEPSAAKMLKFKPAVRNGVAVKYRLYIPWILQSPG